MRPLDVDARYTRKARRDSERMAERYDARRRPRRADLVRAAAEAPEIVIQSVAVYPGGK